MASAGRPLRGLRIAAVALGVAILLAALSLDKLGLGQPGSFGLGQLLLALLGVALALLGLLGARAARLHRGTAILLLNTLVVLALIELAAIAISRLGAVPTAARTLTAHHLQQPYYVGRDWSETYWREAFAAEAYRYEPYVGWRHAPFAGETVNVDERGVRATPGSECTAGALTLFTFGGSSMWGWGSPDWGTIASHLRNGLDEQLERPVCVVNLGEDAWVSTQALVALMAELQIGNAPDVALFYDGVNEVFAAFETGRPAVHLELARIAARFEERQHPVLKWLGSLRSVSLARRLMAKPEHPWPGGVSQPARYARPTTELAAEVVDAYLQNQRMVRSLAKEFGFRSFFFWQPNLAIDGKKLTPAEEEMRSGLDPSLVQLSREAYRKLARAAPDRAGLWYIADVFDEQVEQVWIDAKGHVTPRGNELVARRMLELFGPELASDGPSG